MAPIVTEAFKLYATGNYNARDLCDLMCAKGLRNKNGSKFSPSCFYELLRNPIYVGEVRWGKIHNKEGKHLPLIDRETFGQVQIVLDGHNSHACRKRKYTWLLSGFVYCALHGKRYTAEWHLNKKLAYYHCPNRGGCGKYIEMNQLEDEIAAKFKDLQFNPEFVDRIITKVKEIFYLRRKNYESKRQALINQKTAFDARMKVAEDKLLEKVMSNDDFTRVRKEIKANIKSIEERIFELEAAHDTKVDVAQEVLRFTENIFKTYSDAPFYLKRHYLSFFWDKFEVSDGVIITSTPGLLFRELLRLEQVYVKNQNTQKDSVFGEVILKDTWLRAMAEVRTAIRAQRGRSPFAIARDWGNAQVDASTRSGV